MRLRPSANPRRAYSLIEMLIVITLMSILAGLMLPRFEPSIPEQLQGASQILGADLAYARNLAVTNGTSYTVEILGADNAYVLRHTGDNNLFDVLPVTPYRNSGDSPDQQSTYMDDLPRIGAGVSIVGVRVGTGSLAADGEIEFDALGGLTDTQPVTIWLAAGQDGARRYLSLTVSPVTGLVTYGALTGVAP